MNNQESDNLAKLVKLMEKQNEILREIEINTSNALIIFKSFDENGIETWTRNQ